MNSLLQIFRRLYWRGRHSADLPPASQSELRYRILRLPEITSQGGFFTFPWGRVEFLNPSDLRGQFAEIFDLRHYAFRAKVPNPVIIDCGGNVGMSAIWFRREYPQSRVTVYEADPELTKVLQRNLAAAKVTEVNVVNAAVWTHDGTVSFDNQGRDMGAIRDSGKLTVPAVDLAAHLPERVDLLKLDIEGAEYALVKRLCATGAIARIQNLVAEYHIRRGDFDALLESLQLLRQAGFQVTMTAESGGWMGQADAESPFELMGRNQILAEVYAWR